MTRVVPAAAGAAMAVLIAVASAAGVLALSAALVLAAVLVAAGWAVLLSLPSPRGSTAVVALAGAVAVAAVALTVSPPYLRWLPVVLALAVLGTFGHQLLRRDMRPRLVESVTGVLAGVVLVSLGAAWVGALQLRAGPALVLAGAAAALGAAAATGFHWPQRVTGPSAVLAGLAFGALAGRVLDDVQALPMAVLGAAIGVVVAALDHLCAVLPTVRHLNAGVAMGTAPVAASGLVVYALGRLVV